METELKEKPRCFYSLTDCEFKKGKEGAYFCHSDGTVFDCVFREVIKDG